MESWYKMSDELKKQIYERLEQLASVADRSEADRIAYDRVLDSFRVSLIVEQDTIERVRKAREEGFQKGYQEGLQQGREEEKYRIAGMLKSKGVALDVICTSTGLSEEDIKVF